MKDWKLDAGEIEEIEEQDDIVKVLAAYMGDVPSDVRFAIKDRVEYFFGIKI